MAGPAPVVPPVTRDGVHPTAVVGDDVELGPGVRIEPYCVIQGRVTIGAGTVVHSHTVIHGVTEIGVNCRLGPYAAVGTDSQARAYDGRETWLVLGDDVTVREFASVNRSMLGGREHATFVGSGTLIMATAHVAHDCIVGERVTLANGAMLAGHVTVGDAATIGGDVQVHQFCRVGRLAIVGGGETVLKDVLPFGAFRNGGHRAYNVIGVRRSGMAGDVVRLLRQTFTEMNRAASYPQAAKALRERYGDAMPAAVREIVEYIESSPRGVEAAVGRGRDDDA